MIIITVRGGSNMQIRTFELLNQIKSLLINRSENKWLSIKEVTNYASISESTIRRAVKKGSLKASKATGKLLLKTSDIDKWLNT
tara:strand:- start:130 stop:381 length:252 start_codon:yes stop_codon:yes gene_type:complete